MYYRTIIPFIERRFVFENEESYKDYLNFLEEFFYPREIDNQDADENDYMYLVALELAEIESIL